MDVADAVIAPAASSACGAGKLRCSSVCTDCRVRLFAVCSALSNDEIFELEQLSHPITIGAKSPLFAAGDAAQSVYTVTSGTIRLQRDLADGRRQVIGFAIPGDFIGLALDERFGFSADALTQATLCRFERGRFEQLAIRKTGLLARLHEVATHELGFAQEHMVVLGRRRAEERVAAFLLRWSGRMEKISGSAVTLHLPMGRQDIADHLGLTIETISRIMARWMRERLLLDVPDGVRLLDRDRLNAILVS